MTLAVPLGPSRHNCSNHPVQFLSEFILWREKRKRQSNGVRFFNEFLLAFSAIALLGGCIA